MTLPEQPYRVEVHRKVEKFLKRHRDLAARFEGIRSRIALSPYTGADIVHMKKRGWHCSRRWTVLDKYRLIYEVNDGKRLVHIFHAGPRGQVYR
jgi:mRNA-degrading endonuclease RelE of RelBE toxin-antitoxin system